jgi:hypothetical protein
MAVNLMFRNWAALIVCMCLASCGGGGGGSSSPPPSGGGPTQPPQTITKSYSIELSAVQVTQTSTGEVLNVDTSGIASNGTVEVSN